VTGSIPVSRTKHHRSSNCIFGRCVGAAANTVPLVPPTTGVNGQRSSGEAPARLRFATPIIPIIGRPGVSRAVSPIQRRPDRRGTCHLPTCDHLTPQVAENASFADVHPSTVRPGQRDSATCADTGESARNLRGWGTRLGTELEGVQRKLAPNWGSTFLKRFSDADRSRTPWRAAMIAVDSPGLVAWRYPAGTFRTSWLRD
jgi:hypothetical protein